MQHHNENTPHTPGDDYALAVGGALLRGMDEAGSHEADSPMPEVISGRDTGYLRTNPEAVQSLLLQSIADGNVLPGEHMAVGQYVRDAVALAAVHGTTILKSATRRHGLIEEYESSAYIEPGNDLDKSLIIRLVGPVDYAEVASRTEAIAMSVGVRLPEPRVEISFAKWRGQGVDEIDETWRFAFGHDGATNFSYAVDDKDGFRVDTMSAEGVQTFLAENMPTLSTETGEPHISKGMPAAVSVRTVRYFFSDIHLNRLKQPDDPIRQRNDAKRAQYGYEAVMYIPEHMFEAGNREGEFLAIDYDSRLIPDDVIEHAATRQRIEAVARDLGITVDEQTAASLEEIADGLPGGRASVATLAQPNLAGYIQPTIVRVPTAVMDKSVRYLLEHRDEMQEVTTALTQLHELFGEPVIPDHIEYAIRYTLADEDVIEARQQFEISARGFGPNSQLTDAHAQAALDNSFAALQRLAGNIKSTLTPDELAVMVRETTE